MSISADDTAVEHGVDEVRPALVSRRPDPFSMKEPQKGTGQKRFATAASRRCNQEPRYSDFRGTGLFHSTFPSKSIR